MEEKTLGQLAYERWVLLEIPFGAIAWRNLPQSQRDVWEQVAQAVQPQWQPIETAPKDGTRILLHLNSASGSDADIFRWDGREWLMADEYGLGMDVPAGWMPLPQPPEQQS